MTSDLEASTVKAWRNAIFVVFALTGIGLSSWVSRTPAVRDVLDASTAQMGWIIFGLAAGSIAGLTTSSHVIARVGGRWTILGALLLAALGLAVVGVGALAAATGIIIAGLALFGAGYGLCDVAMNVEGAANEHALDRTIMPLFHAAFSVGTIIGAGLGTLAEFSKVPVVVHLVVVAAVLAGTILATVRFIPVGASRPEAEEADAAGPVTRRTRLAVWREPRTLLIGVIVLGLAFAEGSANDWLALAMVDGHDVSNAVGSLLFGVFVAAMTVGRIAGVKLLDAYGRVPVLLGSAACAVAGLVIVIFVPNTVVASVGVVLWGLGSALGFPVGLSAAADEPRLAAARVSVVATIGYLAFLAGPPGLGLLGEHVGLLHAFVAVLVFAAIAGLASPAARPVGTQSPAAR
ncbi:MFS transporter [Micromonospora polyrhachis]|uniref:Fucose permease n=1 Tax=Micromonospora polyrhachis TaxID=1282883 RepID=A0A7W7SMN5_9ACTN|nr:MFS transporter [Micromonospora polyrhachis]MBB4957580.1 fucose permease [Micromonospora polyrhachis]